MICILIFLYKIYIIICDPKFLLGLDAYLKDAWRFLMSSIINRKEYVKELLLKNREFCKAIDLDKLPAYEDWEPDQSRGFEQPPLQKNYPSESIIIDLIPSSELKVSDFSIPLLDAIKNRKSRRKYTKEYLTLKELSFLLWATQGVKTIDEDVRHGQKKFIKKNVPSGGSLHPFETYLVINRVENIKSGIYRYLFLENKLLFICETDKSISKLLSQLTMGQDFVGESAVFFMWSVIPHRTEWGYSLISHKGILIEAGHICQNLYLVCEATNLGTCAIASYDQKGIDHLLSLDGQEEFVIYVAPVGKVKS